MNSGLAGKQGWCAMAGWCGARSPVWGSRGGAALPDLGKGQEFGDAATHGRAERAALNLLTCKTEE